MEKAMPWEALLNESAALFSPDSFLGARLEWNVPISNRFSLNHTFLMGGAFPGMPGANDASLYCLTATTTFRNVALPAGLTAVAQHILFAICDSHLRSQARVFSKWGKSLSTKFQGVFQKDWNNSMAQMEVAFSGQDWEGSVTAHNAPVLDFAYNQQVGRSLQLGGQFSLLVARPEIKYNLGGRWRFNQSSLYLIFGNDANVTLSFIRRYMQHEFGVQFDANCKLGYRVKLTGATVSGTLDTTGVLTTTVEEILSPSKLLSFFAQYSPWGGPFVLGMGLKM